MKKQLVIILISLAITYTSNAQNFSGTYVIQSKEMIDGKQYANAIAQEITVTQTKDSLKIIRITPTAEGKTTTSSESLALNGKKTVTVTTAKRTRTCTVSLDKTKNIATITSLLSFPDKPDEVQFKNTEVWNIVNDTVLTVTKTSDATVTDDWTLKAVFKKL